MKGLLRVTLLLAMSSLAVFSQIPRTLSYQGILTDSLGTPKPDGTYSITFRMYDVATGGNALWTEQKTLNVKRGLFSTALGDQVVIGSNVRFDRQYWLGIQLVTGAELLPRIPLNAVGYSLSSIRADTAHYVAFVDSARIAVTLPNNAVTTIKIADGAVGQSKIADNSVTNEKILDGTILGAKIADATIPAAKLSFTAGTIGGSGMLNYIPKFAPNGSSLGNSALFESGGNIGIGTITPLSTSRLHVASRGRYAGYFSNDTLRADTTFGLYGLAAAAMNGWGCGVYGNAVSGGTNSYGVGVYGRSNAAVSYGVYGAAGGQASIGVFGTSTSGGWAGFFSGNVNATGNLTVTGDITNGGGAFTIDHPLDPANKYLSHSFVESPDMMSIYSGNVGLDGQGQAIVELPNWFESLNKDFRYQLTCIGGFAQVFIAEKVQNNRFRIAGGTPGLEVSWQVTGVRKDAYANAHRVQVEMEKPPSERGKYLHPVENGAPVTMGIDFERNLPSR